MVSDKIILNSIDLLTAGSDVPVLIKDKLLIEPGKWNGILYTEKEISDAYKNTDWSDKEKIALILDHDDGMNEAVKNWVGYIRNPRLNQGGKLVGDLEVWNPLIAMYLTKAKAKFGISAKLKGNEESGNLKDFTFENFSIVTRPAVRTAYINLSDNSHLLEKKLKGGFKMTEEEIKKLQDDKDEDEEVSEEDLEELKKKEYPQPVEEQKEDDKEKEEPKEPKEEKQEEAPKEMPKEEPKAEPKEKPKDAKDEEEMSEVEMLEITTNSDWTDFVKQMKAKNPNMSFQDIAKAYKAKSSENKKLEELSDVELLETFNKISAILKKKGKYPPYEEEMKKKEDDLKKKDEENQKLSSKIEELQAKMQEPDSKTVTLSEQSIVNADPLAEMAKFLLSNAGKGGRIY
jgi:chemotaxis protein histidine kinase CheA